MPISLSARTQGAFTVVELDGEFDLDTADALRDQLVSAWEQHGGHLLLDLSAVGFIDSTTLSAFLQAERAGGDGGALCLAGLQRGPAKVLRVSGLDQHFTIYASAGEVLDSQAPPVAG